jgi:GntR family transcriptional regulator
MRLCVDWSYLVESSAHARRSADYEHRPIFVCTGISKQVAGIRKTRYEDVSIDSFCILLYPYTSTVNFSMLFRLSPIAGQPLYLQLMQQIRHAVESGALQHGDQLPGIRTLAEELVVSPNTVVKAYSELEHEGLLELRQGSGAFVSVKRSTRSQIGRVHEAHGQVRKLIEGLREMGLNDDEIRRVVEAELFQPAEVMSKR